MEEIDILLLSFEGKRNWLTLQIAQYFAQIHMDALFAEEHHM